MRHRFAMVSAGAVAVGLFVVIARAQAQPGSASHPSFEVATIRLRQPHPEPPPPEATGPQRPVLALVGKPDAQSGDRIAATGSIRFFIASAYDIATGSESRIVGGPAWLDSDTYDIQAKIGDALFAAMQTMPAPERRRQVEGMEQTLLTDRFHLKAHWETRILPVYALVAAVGGPKLTPARSDEATLLPVIFNGSERSLTAAAVTMDQFIHSPLWRSTTDRILVDRTGLAGRYDFTLKWSAVSAAGADADAAAFSQPSLFTAVQEQLGLRLVPGKAPVEVLVIDHIERPSGN